MAITGLSHWTLSVTDVDRSSRFYSDVMGWRPAGGPGRFVKDGQRVSLAALPGPTARTPRPEVHHLGLSHMTVASGPADDTMKRLLERNVCVREHTLGNFIGGPDDEGTQFLFEDPDGNIIETFLARPDWNPFGIGDSDTGAGSGAGILHLSHWSLCVADPEVSLPFYRDVLGWTEIVRLDWEGPGPSRVMDVGPARLTTWLLGSGGQRIEIIHFAEPPSPPRVDRGAPGLSHLTVLVDDGSSTAGELRARGIDATVSDGTVMFEDPDGNRVVGVSTLWER
jgi:catechol 2,3-dioxygenase-like lactoylglutathione lyase family enzyme